MQVVRGSLDSSKALTMGFGIQEGRLRVEDARFKVIQRQQSEKKGGKLVTPMLVLQLDCKKLNENNVAESDVIETTELLVAFASKEEDEQGRHMFVLWPGNIKGDPASADSELQSLDQGMADDLRAYCAIDTEGNTFVSIKGAMPFADSEAMLFMKSLEKKGWKPENNNQCFAGNYKGAILEVRTVLKADACKELGVKFTPAKDADPTRPQTVWQVTNILNRPYEGKKVVAKAASTVAKSEAASTGTNGPADDKSKAAFGEFIKTQAGKTLSQIDLQKLAGPALMKAVGLKEAQNFINTCVKPLEALAMLGFEFGFEVDGEKKTVTIA